MTKVEFIYEKGKIVSFTASGHSGYAPEGEDIVCASISTAVWMTANALINILALDVEYEEKGVCISLKVNESAVDDSQVMLINLKEFLCNLTIEYGKYLTVKEEHVNV